MGIQINGNTDTISAVDGGLTVSGADFTGVSAGTTAAPSISPSGDSNTGIFFPSADTIAFSEGGTEALRLTSTGTVQVSSVNDGPLAGFRNFIINGNMAISQRGTSFTSINTYNLDRYRTFGGPITHTITQQDSIATYSPSRYALRAARNSGDTQTNELGIAQGIESQNSYALRGKTVTVSFRARCGANFSSASSTLLVRVFTGTGTDQNPVSMTGQNSDISQSVTLTTSLQTFSVTGTLSASLTQATLAFSYTATGTAGANDWFEITDVQLEKGTVGTPFELRPIGTEFSLCQRYFQERICGHRNDNSNSGTASFDIQDTFPVRMRTTPTATVISTSGTTNFSSPNYISLDFNRGVFIGNKGVSSPSVSILQVQVTLSAEL